MTLKETIKQKILKFLGIEKLADNPNDERYSFLSNEEEVRLSEVKANKVWYIGSGDELLNYYTARQAGGFAQNPIYNRNKRNYFWSLSAEECKIKRIHSGIPNAIITTLSNVIGTPNISEPTGEWDKIAKENDFTGKLNQQIRPLTMAEGWGAVKVNFNTALSKYPMIEYYDAENVEYIVKCGILFGIVFKSFYKKDQKNYVLLETRYRAKGNSYIDFSFYELGKGDVATPVSMDVLPELADIPRETQIIEGYDKITAVPFRYFYDVNNPKYGKSIYAGKLDFFDMLDEVWSQASQTNRVSTPITWYNKDVLSRGANGELGIPSLYNRQLLAREGVPNGEGLTNQDIVVDQPELNFDKYGALASDILGYILTGVLSPATMGIDVAKKDNAEAQREKEKVTIMTRNNIIASEQTAIERLIEICLDMKEYIDTGVITIKDDYGITVAYNEFANPSAESMLDVLTPTLTNGAISPELFVEKVYGKSLSEEDKQHEIDYIKEKMEQDSNLGLDGLMDDTTQLTEQGNLYEELDSTNGKDSGDTNSEGKA